MALDAFPVKGNVGLDSDQNSSSLLSHQISPLGANSVGTKWYLIIYKLMSSVVPAGSKTNKSNWCRVSHTKMFVNW